MTINALCLIAVLPVWTGANADLPSMFLNGCIAHARGHSPREHVPLIAGAGTLRRPSGWCSDPQQRRVAMDKDRIKGSAEQAKGKVKEVAGKVTGDSKTEAEGKADQVKGKVRNTVGGLKDSLRDE
jgi:uncharacterized protein YjbJ (UPF0337 family)